MKLPKQLDLLEIAAQQIIAGLDLHGKSLAISNSLRVNAENALGELRKADPQFDKPSPLVMQSIGPAVAKANYLAGSLIGRAKEVLRAQLGEEWSPGWAEAGFTDSTQTPGTVPERIELLASLSAYFESHPERADVRSDVTAGQLAMRGQELEQAFQSSSEHSRTWSEGVSNRSLAGERLRSALQAILGELGKALPADDPRWAQFTVHSEVAPLAPVTVRRGRPRRSAVPQDMEDLSPSVHLAKSEASAEFQLWRYACQLAEKAKVQAGQAREALARAEANMQRLRAEADQANVMAKSLQAKADLLAPAAVKPSRQERALGNERSVVDMSLPG